MIEVIENNRIILYVCLWVLFTCAVLDILYSGFTVLGISRLVCVSILIGSVDHEAL